MAICKKKKQKKITINAKESGARATLNKFYTHFDNNNTMPELKREKEKKINVELMEKKGEQTLHLNSLAARSEETSNDSTFKKTHTHTLRLKR